MWDQCYFIFYWPDIERNVQRELDCGDVSSVLDMSKHDCVRLFPHFKDTRTVGELEYVCVCTLDMDWIMCPARTPRFKE